MARPRAAWWWLSPANWACPFNTWESAKPSKTCCPSTRESSWNRCSRPSCPRPGVAGERDYSEVRMTIKAVVFDYGNVLNEPPHAARYQALARLTGIDEAEFLDRYWRNRLEYDRSNPLDGNAYWQEVAKGAGKELSTAQIGQLIDLDARLWTDTRPALMEWVRILRMRGCETAVLSNMPREIGAHLRAAATWLGLFNLLIFSEI